MKITHEVHLRDFRTAPVEPPVQWNDEDERLLREYRMCFERYLSMNSQVWQVPALAITAQAFLFSIMFSSETGQAPRMASAVLAIAAAYLSIHVMTKHRHHQSLDYGRMAEIEDELGFEHFSFSHWARDTSWEGKVNKILSPDKKLQLYKHRYSSVTIWVCGLWFFALVAAAVFVTAKVAPSLYEQSPSDPPPFVLVIGD